MLVKRIALLSAFAAIVFGVFMNLLTHTEEAAAAELAKKETTPLVQTEELTTFPAAEQWRVLYRMTQGEWLNAQHGTLNKRADMLPADKLIEHTFAYLPAGAECPLSEGADPLPRSAAMMLNRCLKAAGLPQVQPSFIKAAGKRRFYPDEAQQQALWYDVTYFCLEDGVIFVELSRIPFSQMRPERYQELMAELREEK